MSHWSIFVIPSCRSRSSLHISHSPTVWVLLYCFATTAHLCYFLLLPTTGIPLSPFLAGPGPLHEIAVSAFLRSPLGRANTFSFLFLFLTLRQSLKWNISSLSPWILALAFPLIYIFSFTSVLHPANFSMDSISSWFAPIFFRTFSTTLSHLTPARPFVTFSHTALSPMPGNLFFWHIPYFLTSLFDFKWVRSQVCS